MNPAEHNKLMFTGHELVEDQAQCWHLRNPENPHNPVTVTVTDDGVMLQYPWHPGGQVTKMRLADFVSEITPEYLAGWFLRKRWSRVGAEKHYDALVQQMEQLGIDGIDEGYQMAEELRDRKQLRPEMFDSIVQWQKHLGDLLEEMINGIGRFSDPLIEADEAYPSPEHDPDEVSKLAAIHDRFRELFMASYRIRDGKAVRRTGRAA